MKKNGFNLGLSSIGLPRKILVIMKLIIVLMTTCLLQVSAGGFAQKLTYSKKGATLEQIFTEIRKQTGYYVVYSENKIDKNTKLDVNFKNTDLNDVLDVIGKSQDLTYSFDERNISLKPKEPGFIENIIARFQAIDVRGKVVDSLGNGLAGATVSVKNGKGSTSTDNNGVFYLKNIEEDAVLVVSYLGYVTKEQRVNTEFTYVQLVESTSFLDVVQVQAYGLTSRRLSTGNITTIKAEDISKQPVNNPLYALQGRIPNLVVTPTSGLPGAPVSLQLRGQNSLSGLKTEPLIVIDGVPYSNNIPGHNGSISNVNSVRVGINALSFINPADIESIDVLSDADATSIYGSRGGSGVILITTKKGKIGKTKINANVSSGFSEVPAKLDLLNSQQYLEMREEALINDDITPQATNPNGQDYAPDLLLWDPTNNTDWQDMLIGGKGSQYNTQASISGGSPAIQYLLSATYNKQRYIFPGNEKDENGGGLFSISGISSNSKFKATMAGSYHVSNRPSGSFDFTTAAFRLAPNAPAIYKANGELNWEPHPTTGLASWSNPFALLLRTSTVKTSTVNSNIDLSYALTSAFKFKTSIGFSELSLNGLSLRPISSLDPAAVLNNPVVNSGSVARSHNISRSWTIDPQMSYSNRINKGMLEILFGTSIQRQNLSSETYSAVGYVNDALLRNLNGGYSSLVGSNSSSQYKYAGIFGRIHYNWENKYLLNLSARRDGSSKFGPDNQFGNFASLGLAWIFSEEKLIKLGFPFLSHGKLRASYGSSGNDGIGDYQYMELYRVMNGSYQGSPLINSLGAVNSYYRWESIKKAEIALEMGFVEDRLFLTAAYYRNRSSNQLGRIDLPATGGATFITANQGAKIQNMGWEFTVNSHNIVGRHFLWSTTANLGLQRNKLLFVPTAYQQSTVFNYRFRGEDPIGKPFNGIEFLYDMNGVNPSTGIYQFTDNVGNIISYGSGIINSRANIVTTGPEFSGGISNAFTYKGLSLDVFFQFTKQKGRNPIYDLEVTRAGYFDGLNSYGNQLTQVLQRWQKSGDLTSIQRYSSLGFGFASEAASAAYASDEGWVDASFVRLKNISLSYTIPNQWRQTLKLSDMRFYLQAQNLWTITAYKGSDPEAQSITALPPLRTISIGIQLGI